MRLRTISFLFREAVFRQDDTKINEGLWAPTAVLSLNAEAGQKETQSPKVRRRADKSVCEMVQLNLRSYW